MQVFKRAPSIFALTALIAPALFVAPPAQAQDFRLITTRVISDTVSGMSENKADPGPDQASGANPPSSQQASRLEETPARTNSGKIMPKVSPAQP